MTVQQKKKMLNFVGGSIGGATLALFGFMYGAGVKSRDIEFNTERIKRAEMNFHMGINELKTKINGVDEKIDDLTTHLLKTR